MTQAPAGWFDQGNGTQRYWDGAQWTDHIAPLAAAAPEAPAPAPAPAVEAAPAPVAEVAPAPVAPPAPPAPPAPAVVEVPPPPAPVAPAPVAAPAYQQAPAYAAAPGMAPAPKKRKVWPWVLGGVALVVVLIIVGIVAIVGVALKATTGPRDAVTAFDQAWAAADCDAMQDLTTQDFRDTAGWVDCATFEAAAEALGGSTSFTVNSTDIVNDTATVTTSEEYANDSTRYEFTYHLVNDGGWKIDSAEVTG